MTLESFALFISILGYTATIFSLGYMIGKGHSKKQ